MRKLLVYLMIATLVFPWRAEATSTTDPNHPAFAALKKIVNASDSAGITVPNDDPSTFDNSDGSVNNNGGNIPNPTTHYALTDLNDAINLQSQANGQNTDTWMAGCNPVVWASLVRRGREATIQSIAIASGIHNGLVAPANNKCTTNLGPNGEDRSAVDQAVRNVTNNIFNALESAICTLNFSGLLKGLVGGQISICKNGAVFSGGINSALASTFLENGQNPFKSKDCAQPGALNKNLMQQVSSPNFGSQAINGTPLFNNSSASSFKFNSLSGISTGSGWTFGLSLGGSAGTGSGSGLGITTTTGNTTTSTTIGSSSGTAPAPTSSAVVSTPTTTTPSQSNTSGAQNIFK